MTSTTQQPARPRVVIVGAGFGGLMAARGLRHAPMDILLLDRTNHHLFQPLLYQVATGILAPGEIAPPVRKIMRRAANTRLELGDVTEIQLDHRAVTVCGPDGRTRQVPYDYLIVAAGAQDTYFGHDEWAAHLYPMKTLAHALRLREQILLAYEYAANCTDVAERERWMTFAIVGAGPTGVELAGQLATLCEELRPEFDQIDPTCSRIVLIDALDELLTSFPETLRTHAKDRLRSLGVDIALGAKVTDVDTNGITITTKDGPSERIETHTAIWAAGVRASPLAAALATEAEVDGKGRVRVRPDCSVPGHPEVFAIGDLANLDDLPGLCEPAMQQGSHVAKVLRNRASEKSEPAAFAYRDLGTTATISGTDAIAEVFGVKLHGPLGKLAWALVHIAFLIGWGNRAGVLVRWLFLGLTRTRPERMIVHGLDRRASDPANPDSAAPSMPRTHKRESNAGTSR
ncbi:MAG: NAD(P)/FAD-dependent oxidoreductase [Actinomycetota bacterium]|nr:NAD(P)/FAD-dependent oxidoreductase [Actinomycetota bacterium]